MKSIVWTATSLTAYIRNTPSSCFRLLVQQYSIKDIVYWHWLTEYFPDGGIYVTESTSGYALSGAEARTCAIKAVKSIQKKLKEQ